MMRVVDRLIYFLNSRSITAYAFEKAGGLGNGYLGKQAKGKGSIGSPILEIINQQYPELNLHWLITGEGSMILRTKKGKEVAIRLEMQEQQAVYKTRARLISIMKQQIKSLEAPLRSNNKKR